KSFSYSMLKASRQLKEFLGPRPRICMQHNNSFRENHQCGNSLIQHLRLHDHSRPLLSQMDSPWPRPATRTWLTISTNISAHSSNKRTQATLFAPLVLDLATPVPRKFWSALTRRLVRIQRFGILTSPSFTKNLLVQWSRKAIWQNTVMRFPAASL